MSVVLRSQIPESEAIRQTQASEHICFTTGGNRDSAILMRGALTLQVFLQPQSAVAINNEIKNFQVISHRSLVIYH
ncbi:hypothetical protein QUB68_12165 [Microcoleus sp. A006_D1]|uniref:hypothetical protein n=1 Tax=Microcoleus sp. A006_D1 TaxID=3055267 RepID=UPI002FD70606